MNANLQIRRGFSILRSTAVRRNAAAFPVSRALHHDKLFDDSEADDGKQLPARRPEPKSLYRSILRLTRYFRWPDPRGVPMREVLREKARREFEAARLEKDPEVVDRLLDGAAKALHAALEEVAEGQRQKIEKLAAEKKLAEQQMEKHRAGGQ